MSTVAALNSSDSNALLSLLRRGSTAETDASPQESGKADAASAKKDNPATVVDLSDRAKAVLERNKVELAAADRLAQQVAAGKGGSKSESAQQARTDDASKLFGALSGKSASQTTNSTNWEAGSKWGDASISDAAFTAEIKDSLLGALTGFPPEKQEALRAAIASGTLKFQKGSDVAGYNTRTTVTYSGGSGGQGMSTSGYRPPTGAAKEAIDAGNAVGLWTADRGDVYVTW